MNNIFRVLDANINRAREGLRVVEEVVRFIWNDAALSLLVKNARHNLQKAQAFIPGGIQSLVASRDSAGDVGAQGIIKSEMNRASLNDLVVANLTRVQEAARVLEEFSKFIGQEAAESFKQFRFAAYSLEKAVVESHSFLSELSQIKSLLDFQLYVIVGDDHTLAGRDMVEVAADAIDGGAGAIQMRVKKGRTRDLLQTGYRLRELTSSKGVTFIVNDRPDIALAVNADGVHLGQDDLPACVARDILGPGRVIGISTHSVEQALMAVRDGADYIGVGPVFGTATKKEAGNPVGIGLLKSVSAAVQVPIVAIGGINAGNVVNVVEAGVTRCAVISAVTSAQDVVSAARKIKSSIQNSIKVLKSG